MTQRAGVLARGREPRLRPVSGSWSSAALVVLRAAIGVALFVYVLKAGGGLGAVRGLLGAVWVVVVLNAIPIIGAAIAAPRLGVLFGAQGLSVPLATGFRTVAIATLFNLWVPGGTGGDVMKLYYLSRLHPGRVVQIATILFADRLVAFCALLGLIGGLLAASSSMLSSAVLGRIAALLIVVVLCVASVVGLMWSRRVRETGAYRIVTGRWRLGRFLAQAADALYAFRTRRSALVLASAYSLAGHVLLAVVLAAAGAILLPEVPAVLVATLALLGLVANVIPVTPGGVGVGEAASEALFRWAGVSGGGALIAAWRVGMLAISVLGAVFYIFGDRMESRRA
jgi:uncharacterized protein (TIRG00374 family)